MVTIIVQSYCRPPIYSTVCIVIEKVRLYFVLNMLSLHRFGQVCLLHFCAFCIHESCSKTPSAQQVDDSWALEDRFKASRIVQSIPWLVSD